jgi:hypothetical protein
MNRQNITKGNMMYNTMYGGVSQNNGTQSAMQKQGGPIHIKIEDQTGVNGMGKVIPG